MKMDIVNLAVIALLIFSPTAMLQAGTLNGTPEEYVSVIVPLSCNDPASGEEHITQARLGFLKVSWDNKDGHLVDARGVKPVIEILDQPSLPIVSDLKKPSLKDGVLTLTIDGQSVGAGKVDVPIIIKNGRTGTIPDENVQGCSAGCCFVSH
jgi:hypothetical protein